MTSSGEAIRRTPTVATIDHRWTAPLGQKLNDQRILKQCCCRFREMGSKITLKACYVKRLPTVAYVGAWLIHSQATNHEPYQKCRPAKNFIFKQTRRVSGAKTLQQKPSQFHQKAGPVLGSKKRALFGGPFSMLTLRAIPFPIWNPKKGSIFPPQNWGFFLLFFCCCYCTFAPKGWLIFIRISNSGRPTVLTVGSWFVLWLLNNRPALHTVAYVGAWLIHSQATNHEPYQKCRPAKNFIFKQTRRVSGAKTLQQKPSQFHQKADPVLGSKKRALFGGPFSMLTLRAIPFPIWNPKKGSIFPPQNWGFFLLFFCCCYCTFAPKGWLIFIRISNSGRPTVLTVGSWFVLWLLNNRPALHTSCICWRVVDS